MRTRAPSPIALARGRTGRRVRVPHWFWSPTTRTFDDGGDSWAEALSRIGLTGETLVVKVPPGDPKTQRTQRRSLVASIYRSAQRRALTVRSQWDGEHGYLLFTVPQQ